MAYDAVPASWGSNSQALWAKRWTIKQLQQLHEINVFIYDVARIRHDQNDVDDQCYGIHEKCNEGAMRQLSTVDLHDFCCYHGEE